MKHDLESGKSEQIRNRNPQWNLNSRHCHLGNNLPKPDICFPSSVLWRHRRSPRTRIRPFPFFSLFLCFITPLNIKKKLTKRIRSVTREKRNGFRRRRSPRAHPTIPVAILFFFSSSSNEKTGKFSLEPSVGNAPRD